MDVSKPGVTRSARLLLCCGRGRQGIACVMARFAAEPGQIRAIGARLHRLGLRRRSGRLRFTLFAEDLFPLAGAGRAFAGLAFDCAFLAAVFGFWAFTFAFLSLAQRAFAALIFALASAESLRCFRGAAVSAARPADRSISAASCERVSCSSAICSSSPGMARRSNPAGSSLFVLSID
jgi:hypothetical protein